MDSPAPANGLATSGSASCPICGHPTRTHFHGLYDDRYGYNERFDLQACRSCGHMHLPAHFTPQQLEKLYTEYYPRREFDLDTFAPEAERSGFDSWMNGDRASAFRWVPKNVRVLDIGCGIGSTLAYHRARGCEAVGVETDSNVQLIAQRYGLDIRQGVFDQNNFEPNSFDFVTLDQVAEHVTDPNALFRGIAYVLKPGGVAILTTPNAKGLGARLFGRYWLNWHAPYHLQFYTPKSLKHVVKGAGLQLFDCKVITASEWQYYQWRHILSFPKFAEKSDFWSPAETPRTPISYKVTRLLSLARDLRLQQWITRLLDATGLGDNYIFFLRKP